MNMQRVKLDIISDIFDKVMFFLENLPKNKIDIYFFPLGIVAYCFKRLVLLLLLSYAFPPRTDGNELNSK